MKTAKFLIPLFVTLLALSLYLVFFAVPVIPQLGAAGKILYIHVPSAWGAVLAFLGAGFSAVFFLKTRRNNFGQSMHRAAILGVIFICIATITGSIWAKIAWGSFWNWDVRETSIMILLLVYCAYFALRAFSSGKRTVTVSAAYLVYAALLMPIFIFVIPRLYPTLHPETIINRQGRIHLEPVMRAALFFCVAAWTVLFFLLMNLPAIISSPQKKVKVRKDDLSPRKRK